MSLLWMGLGGNPHPVGRVHHYSHLHQTQSTVSVHILISVIPCMGMSRKRAEMQFSWGNAMQILYSTAHKQPVLPPHHSAYPLISHCNHCQVQLKVVFLTGESCTDCVDLVTRAKNFMCLAGRDSWSWNIRLHQNIRLQRRVRKQRSEWLEEKNRKIPLS